jgi:hypothetical protein
MIGLWRRVTVKVMGVVSTTGDERLVIHWMITQFVSKFGFHQPHDAYGFAMFWTPQRCHSLVCFFGANSIYVWLATSKREKTSFWVDPKILVAIRWNIHHVPDFSQARKKQEPSGDLVKLPSPKRFLVQQWFPIIPRGNQTWCETSPFSSNMFQWKPHFEMISPVGTTLMIIGGWFFH